MIYRRPAGVDPIWLDNRPLLTTPQGGRVAVDAALLRLWEQAAGRGLEAILAQYPEPAAQEVRLGLACLAEAGLLEREGYSPPEAAPSPTASAPLVSAPLVSAPLVSALIISQNSQEWLPACLDSLLAQTYTPLEIILVDNASDQDPSAWLAAHYPQARAVRLAQPVSFAAALAAGAGQAGGDFFLLLNPDVVLAPQAVARLAARAAGQADCAAVAAKLRFTWAPAFLNGLGNRVGLLGWGVDLGLGCLDLGQLDGWQAAPSACFAAALIPRPAWQAVGPPDAGFPLYYEDAEWCYRARLLGWQILACPQAVVYHAMGSRVPGGQAAGMDPARLRKVTYGRLRFAAKLLATPRRQSFLLAHALEDAARCGLAALRGRFVQGQAALRAWGDFLGDLPAIRRERGELHARRRRSDREMLASPVDPPPPLTWRGLPELTWETVRSVYLPLVLAGSTRPMPEFSPAAPHILVISNDQVDTTLAGPGARYLELARHLGQSLPVTLAVPNPTSLADPAIRLASYSPDDPAGLKALVEASQVTLLTPFTLNKFPFLAQARARLVVDLYDPFLFENLHYHHDKPPQVRAELDRTAVQALNRAMQAGDFFLCASQRQRDFYLGLLAANGRINAHTFAQDASLEKLIAVVGLGFPERPPASQPFLRGVHPAFPPQARIVVWGGGIWDWLDPLSLVQAWPQVIAGFPQARLVFLGTRHPNPEVPIHRLAQETQALAARLGEVERSIFFFEWLPAAEREALLSEADVGVALHPAHVETRFSIRTRVLDYFWARLPVLVSAGDVTSEWVGQLGLGRVVPPGDVQAVAEALNELLAQPKAAWAPAFAALPEHFRWAQVIQPLREYCLAGQPAADHQAGGGRRLSAARTSWRGGLARAIYLARTQGAAALIRRAWRLLQARLAR